MASGEAEINFVKIKFANKNEPLIISFGIKNIGVNNITLPVPYTTTSYVVEMTPQYNSTNAVSGREFFITNKTTTTVLYGYSNHVCYWLAIGY